MVILLHRESMYERESPREGEADLIVAKHRSGPTDTITVAVRGHSNLSRSYPTLPGRGRAMPSWQFPVTLQS